MPVLEIEGTLAQPQPRGRLQIADGALALSDLRTALEGIGLQVEFSGQEARIVQAQARSSEGGNLRVEGAIDLSGEQAIANLTLHADGLTLREPKLPVLEGSAQAVISGAVQVQGTLTEPQVQGALRVKRGFLYLPPELPERTAGEPLPFNPRFDLRVDIADEFTLRNPNLDARMEGALQIGGALQAPSLVGRIQPARRRAEPAHRAPAHRTRQRRPPELSLHQRRRRDHRPHRTGCTRQHERRRARLHRRPHPLPRGSQCARTAG
jgi:autotransporter translocation and assembly factor TamB